MHRENLLFISVIVPYRNAMETLEGCVRSLLNQSYPRDSYEIIMVDNNLSDEETELLNRYKTLVLLKEKKKGQAIARNRGAAVAKGEILVFTDADCVADRDWLKSLAEAFREESIVSVAGEIQAYKPTTDIEVFYERHMSHRKSLLLTHPYAVTANLAVRHSVFSQIGGFDEQFLRGEDVDFSWTLQHRGYKIIYEPRAKVYHKNIKAGTELFKKFFLQGFYAPKIIKKHIRFLREKEPPPKVNLRHYRSLFLNLREIVISGRGARRRQIFLEVIFLTARKAGLLCGSARFGFLYI